MRGAIALADPLLSLVFVSSRALVHFVLFVLVQYLKEQRIGTATFIPLESIKPKQINEAYRRLGGSMKLAIDVIDIPDDKYVCCLLLVLVDRFLCLVLIERLQAPQGVRVRAGQHADLPRPRGSAQALLRW